MFADVITIYTSGKNIFNKTLNKLENFSNKTDYKFSQVKTTITVFSR